MTLGTRSDSGKVHRRPRVQRMVRRAWQWTSAIVITAVVSLLLVHGMVAAKLSTTDAIRGMFFLTAIGLAGVTSVGFLVVRLLVLPRSGDDPTALDLWNELEELGDRVEDLERSNRELSEFAHVASHDLKEPLQMVQGSLQLLERRSHDWMEERSRELVEQAVDGTKRMADLIDGLLAYARAGAGVPDVGRVPVQEVVDEALESLSVKIEETDARVETGQLPTVAGDRVGLIQVFQNLIGNAIKFSREDVRPRVSITAEREGDEWRIDVEDNGIGFDPEDAPALFEAFERGEDTGSIEGSGVGLSVVDRVVRSHGGSVEASSVPGEGSTFSVRLPVSDGERGKTLQQRSEELI